MLLVHVKAAVIDPYESRCDETRADVINVMRAAMLNSHVL